MIIFRNIILHNLWFSSSSTLVFTHCVIIDREMNWFDDNNNFNWGVWYLFDCQCHCSCGTHSAVIMTWRNVPSRAGNCFYVSCFLLTKRKCIKRSMCDLQSATCPEIKRKSLNEVSFLYPCFIQLQAKSSTPPSEYDFIGNWEGKPENSINRELSGEDLICIERKDTWNPVAKFR